MTYPKMRKLDGVYFRVKRGDKYMAVCWTDLTDDERERFSADRPASWWKSMAEHLAERLRHVGDELDIEFMADEDCRDDMYTSEQFGEWMLENHPVTHWQWALEDAKVALSEVMRNEGEYETKAEFEHMRRAAMYEVSSRANELERVKRVRTFQLQDKLIREMYDLLERCNNDDVAPSTDEVNAVYRAICDYASAETLARMEVS